MIVIVFNWVQLRNLPLDFDCPKILTMFKNIISHENSSLGLSVITSSFISPACVSLLFPAGVFIYPNFNAPMKSTEESYYCRSHKINYNPSLNRLCKQHDSSPPILFVSFWKRTIPIKSGNCSKPWRGIRHLLRCFFFSNPPSKQRSSSISWRRLPNPWSSFSIPMLRTSALSFSKIKISSSLLYHHLRWSHHGKKLPNPWGKPRNPLFYDLCSLWFVIPLFL